MRAEDAWKEDLSHLAEPPAATRHAVSASWGGNAGRSDPCLVNFSANYLSGRYQSRRKIIQLSQQRSPSVRHPCYPGGPRMTRQRWGPPEHRSSSPDNGVDALALLTGLPLGSLHAPACGVARSPRRALVRELGASGYPWHLPQATRARCPLPGPDFHRRVPWYPRHTVRYLFVRVFCPIGSGRAFWSAHLSSS